MFLDRAATGDVIVIANDSLEIDGNESLLSLDYLTRQYVIPRESIREQK